MKKISEWVSELGSHEIYHAEQIAKNFTEETGEIPCWPTHSSYATRQAIKARGLGGTLAKNYDPCAWGYEIATALAHQYANGFRAEKYGRGRIFWDCVEALKTAGK